MVAESSKVSPRRRRRRRSTIDDRAARCVCFKTAFIVCTFCYLSLSQRLFLSTVSLQKLTHTGSHSLGTHTHTHAARSGRGKANEFTQKKLHNTLSDTFTKLARFFFFCFSAMHTGHNNSDNNNKYCVYFCCRATDTFNVAHKTHHTCCMWNIFPRVSKNEPSFIFSLLLVGLLHKGRGKEAHAPRRVQQATATTTTTAATAFAFVIVAFAFVFSLLSRFAFRVAFLLIQWILELCLNIGFIIKYNSHYHRGLLCLFYFCCFVVCSFCCFSCCNCITRLKARTFWVNSHSTQSGTQTHTHTATVRYFLSWGFQANKTHSRKSV